MNKNCINCKHYLREDRLCICPNSRHCSNFVGDYSGCEKWETPEGEEALNAANAAIDVIVKSIDRILETKNKDVLHDWFNDNEGDNLIYECSDNNNADTDKVYDLVERIVFKV